MQKIFEEYGQVVLTAIVAIALVGIIFSSFSFVKSTDAMNTDTDLSYAKSETALEKYSAEAKPTISVADTGFLHLSVDDSFKPVAAVSCVDTEGNSLVPVVTSIVFVDKDVNSQTEVIEYYDAAADLFDIPSVIGKAGVLAVSYKVTDSDNITATKTISYVIDAS